MYCRLNWQTECLNRQTECEQAAQDSDRSREHKNRGIMSGQPPLCEPPKLASKPGQKAPAGTIDCIFHIFGPADRFPSSPNGLYTPSPEADVKAYQMMAETLGIERMVIVNPSSYGTDTRCTVEAIEILGRDHAKAVAVINDSVTDAALRELDRKGFCAARVSSVLR